MLGNLDMVAPSASLLDLRGESDVELTLTNSALSGSPWASTLVHL